MSALTSPMSPLDSRMKQIIGWANTVQNLLYEFKHIDETLNKKVDEMRERYGAETLRKFGETKRTELYSSLTRSKIDLINNPESGSYTLQLFGKAYSRAVGGALTPGEAMALNTFNGLIGPGDSWLTYTLDTLFGWIPGMRVHAVLHDLGGEFGEAFIAPGYLYENQNWFGMAINNKYAGQVEGIVINGGYSINSLLHRTY